MNANVNAQDDDQRTALVLAAELGHIEVVKLLIEHKANIRAQTKTKLHATAVAATKEHLDIVKELAG